MLNFKFINISTKIFFIFLAVMFFNSCDELNPPKDEFQQSVLFNLTKNKANQELFLYRTLNLHEGNNYFWDNNKYDAFFIEGASIELKNSHDSIYHFVYDTTDYKHYKNMNNIYILSGETYLLDVSLNNTNIKGQTTIPTEFAIITPSSNQVFFQENDYVEVPIKWTRSESSRGYLINIYEKYQNSFMLAQSVVLTDTSYNFIRQFPSLQYRIEVIAFDLNYYDHIINKKPYSGIEGAFGCFCSSVLHIVNISVSYR